MGPLRTTALVISMLGLACNGGEGDEGASLFGDGGPGTPAATDDGGTTQGPGDDTSGEDDAPPPPPPPHDSTTGEDGTSSGGESGTDSSDGGSTDSTDSTDSTGSTGGGSDEGDTFDDGTLDVEVINQSMFPQGQCDDVFVTNVSGMAVTWEVELPLPGTINQVWNAEVVEMGGMGLFTGVAFNATLDPGEQAMFGYCVDY